MKMLIRRLKHKISRLALRARSFAFEVNKIALTTAAFLAFSTLIFFSHEATPDFTDFKAGDERKAAFFSYFLPLIKQHNEELLTVRQELSELNDNRDQLSFFERLKARKLAEHYEVEDFSIENPDDWNLLLKRIDIVPPSLALAQAANESAWGTSRFATQGNNFYGHWCYEEGCGLVPKARENGASHEVAEFESAQESVEKYMHNLNHHPAYADLRSIRASLRQQDQPITGLKVISGLESYSERGDKYIEELSAMIRFNELGRYDSGQQYDLL